MQKESTEQKLDTMVPVCFFSNLVLYLCSACFFLFFNLFFINQIPKIIFCYFSEDLPDLAVSHNHHPTGLLHVVTMNNEYIEDAWQTHARNLIDEMNPSDSVKTFLLFRRLFKVIKKNTITLNQFVIIVFFS